MNPERIGGYQILGELGRGAMGVVYRAHDSGIDREVAIKVIRIDAGTSAQEGAQLRQRLIREASVAGRISHPGIVTVYQLGEDGDNVFIVMEFIEGSSLDQLLSNNPAIDRAWAFDILSQIAVALDYAHKSNVVHRDIKPANILVRADGRVKIADFGIAKITAGATSGMTGAGVSLGSPAYMSPEQIQATQIDGRSDQFALATIAFLMLAGRMPFKGNTAHTLMYQIVTADPFDASPTDKPLSAGVRAVLARALAKHPRDRYPDCATFLRELSVADGARVTQAQISTARFESSPPPKPAAQPAPPPVYTPPVINPTVASAPPIPQKQSKSWIMLPVLGGLLLLALLGGGLYWYKTTCCAPAPLPPPPEQQKPDQSKPEPQKPQQRPPEQAPSTSLLSAAASGNVDEVRAFLAKGADVNAPGADGATPLIEAVRNGKLEMAELLIDHEADVNRTDSSNTTALMEAATTSPKIPNPAEFIRLLLKHGAKRGLRDSRGRIAFQRAVETKNTAAVEVLR